MRPEGQTRQLPRAQVRLRTHLQLQQQRRLSQRLLRLQELGPGEARQGFRWRSAVTGLSRGEEACDDGNLQDSDGCDSLCRLPGTVIWEANLAEATACPDVVALQGDEFVVAANGSTDRPRSPPTLVSFDAEGSRRWTTTGSYTSDDRIAGLVGDANGFIAAGRATSFKPQSIGGWMQRWSSDGALVDETVVLTGETGSAVFGIERRDSSSYWILDSPIARQLVYWSFDTPPVLAAPLASGFEHRLTMAGDGGAYVTIDDDVSTLNRFASDGSLLWTVEYETGEEVSNSSSTALASAAAGGVVVAGTDQGQPDRQWLRRFAADGTELWRTDLSLGGDASGDWAEHLVEDPDGNLVAAGWRRQEGGNDGFVAKYDANGVQRWQQILTADGELNVRLCDVVATPTMIVASGLHFLASEPPTTVWVRAFTP